MFKSIFEGMIDFIKVVFSSILYCLTVIFLCLIDVFFSFLMIKFLLGIFGYPAFLIGISNITLYFILFIIRLTQAMSISSMINGYVTAKTFFG